MKQEQQVKHLTLWNCLLFFFVAMSFEIFGIITANLYGFIQLVWAGEFLLLVFLALFSLETFLVIKLAPGVEKSLLTPLILTHVPWLIGPALGALPHLTLPEPHNFLLRKFQILFGLMWITHLFAFSLWAMWRTQKSHLPVSKRFAWVAVFFFMGTTLFTATVCDLSGDEPHYLLMAQSLIHDGDLDLANNYQNKDYQQFYHRGELQPQALEHVIDGKRYSHHPLGPVLMVLPGFALLGRLGASLAMALLAALALYLTLRDMEETGAKGWPLQAVGASGLFSSPLLLFSGLIYPEVPTACLVALSLLLFINKRWGWLGFALGAMLWMHNRNVLIVIPFLLITAWEIKKEKGWLEKGSKLGLGFAVPVIVLSAYFYHIYGVLTPLGAHNEPFTSLFRLSHFWIGFFGLLMDQECGLWFHFPIFGLAVMGGAVLYHTKHPLRHIVLGSLTFYYFFMCFYENLGLTPAARYWVGVVPLLLIAIYFALEKMKHWDFWVWMTVLSFASGVLVNWLLAAVPWMRYNKLNGENWILKIAGSFLHLPLTATNPAFQAPVIEFKSYVLSAIPIGITLALTILFFKHKKIKEK